MKHLNSNILCAVAVQTTGHEILELCVVALTSTCDMDKNILPFNVLFKIEYLDKCEANINYNLLMKAAREGMDKYEAADLFDKWFEKLNLREHKKIMVLTHDWAAQRNFIKDWLQPTAFDTYFHNQYRDTQVLGLHYNDRYDVHNELCPFPKVKLSYMCSQLKLEYTKRLPTVVDKCVAIMRLYKDLLLFK